MKRGHEGGYTIVEVMIVLAVTAGLFAATILLLSGKQAKAEFQQGVRDFEAKIQSVMSDVSAGYYNNITTTCSAGASGQPSLTPVATGGTPGANGTCIFLGKAMIINNPGTPLNIMTVVGRQYAPYTDFDKRVIATSPAETSPRPISTTTENYAPTFNIKLARVKNLGGGAALGGVAFYAELGSRSGGNVITGTRSVHIYGLVGVPPAAITNTAATNYTSLAQGVLFCLEGANGQKAEVTLGTNSSDTNITTQLDTGVGRCAP